MTDHAGHTAEGSVFTEMLIEVFRLNGRLLAAGDNMTADLGLTSARWQVLGAMEVAGSPLTVAQIARNMGLTRQNVQRLANVIAADGLAEFVENPHHKRAKVLRITAHGQKVIDRLTGIQAEWANKIGSTVAAQELENALLVLRALGKQLEQDDEKRKV